MKTVERRIILKSETGVGTHAPPEPVGYVLQHLGSLVRQATLMAFARRSRPHGPPPAWLAAASDLRLLGIDGGRNAVLRFEFPRLGDAVPSFYDRRELNDAEKESVHPSREKTGFDLLTEVVADVAKKNDDSLRFDQPLLGRFLRLGRVLNGAYREIELSDLDHEPSAYFIQETLASAERLKAEIPAPYRVRLVGDLEEIQEDARSFVLRLADGQDVRAALLDGEMDSLKAWINRRVLVAGRAIFRPSGRLLRVDAEVARLGEGESLIWSKMPKPRRRLTLQELRQPQGPTTGAAAIYGKWPGDETEEELLEALREISR